MESIYYYWHAFWAFWRPRTIRRRLKLFWQRCRWGWDDSDTWNLDYTIAEFVLPRLKLFRKVNNGFPPEFSHPEEWDVVLDKIIRAFRLVIKDRDSFNLTPKQLEAMNEGLELFGKYFTALWW